MINRILKSAGIAVILYLVGSTTAVHSEPVQIMAYGNSLTAGYGLPTPEGFTVQLESQLRAAGLDVRIINAGVSGDTTTGGRTRLDWTLSYRPDALILELGANDGLRGIDPQLTRQNIDAILKRLVLLKIPTLFTGMYAPPNLGPEYGAEFRAVYEDLARTHDVDFYPFFLDGVAGIPELNQEDGIHPNADGVAIIVKRILPSVRRLLDRIP